MTALPDTRWLELSLSSGWLTIALNAVEKRNALTRELSDELKAVLMAVHDDYSVRGITLRGNGRVFCAGGDLKAFSSLSTLSAKEADQAAVELSFDSAELFGLVHRAPQVVVALIEGAAVAGGLGLACAADFAFATEDSVFAFSETRLGLVPAQIAPYVIAKTGLRRARRLLLTGMKCNGARAAELGLIDKVVRSPADLNTEEQTLITEVLKCAPEAVALTKQLIDEVAGVDIQVYQNRAASVFAYSLTNHEGREGVEAFFSKKTPSWVPDSCD